jgi:hypothetical protein
MNKHINLSEKSKQLNHLSGGHIVLIDRLGMQEKFGQLECARNIYLVDQNGAVMWQVNSDFDSDGGPFTNVLDDLGELKAYRWDGGMYKIDLNTGFAIPILLTK